MLPFSKCHLSRQTSRIDSAPTRSISCSFRLYFSLSCFTTQQQGRGKNNAEKGHCPSHSSKHILIISVGSPDIAHYCERGTMCEREINRNKEKLATYFHCKNHTGSHPGGFVKFSQNHFVFQLTSEQWHNMSMIQHNMSTYRYSTS